jgi:hypothetical protein
LRITILGKSPSWQDAGGACSGYLIETDETKVLLDCGNGVFGKLREQIDYTELDGVIISTSTPITSSIWFPTHTPRSTRQSNSRSRFTPGTGPSIRRVRGSSPRRMPWRRSAGWSAPGATTT